MSEKFIKTGVIGHPVGHSKSPLIHNHWIKKYRLNGNYEAIDIPCENLNTRISDLKNEGYSGFNVTVPHKIDIMQYCDDLDSNAKIVGAVNTIVIKDNKLHGTNTDVFGFTENIKQNAPEFSFRGSTALILGAGGAARAIVQGLITEGASEIRIANRTTANADALLRHTAYPKKIKIIPWNERSQKKHLQNINILVNTTSLGMLGKADLEMPLDHLEAETLVNDIVYNPLNTDLLKAAKIKGNAVVTGIGMLLHQARPAFQAWYGLLPDVTSELEQMVLK